MKKQYTQPRLKAIQIENQELFMQNSGDTDRITKGDPNNDPDIPTPTQGPTGNNPWGLWGE